MAHDPKPPTPPTLLVVDRAAVDEAVTRLRLAAEAAGLEQVRQERSMAAATVTWIGGPRTRAEHDAAALEKQWADLANDLRRAATDVRIAEVAADQENRKRQAAFDEAVLAYRTEVAARAAATAAATATSPRWGFAP